LTEQRGQQPDAAVAILNTSGMTIASFLAFD
jgi:hypothetical protein